MKSFEGGDEEAKDHNLKAKKGVPYRAIALLSLMGPSGVSSTGTCEHISFVRTRERRYYVKLG
jgi:hypothetical protein